MTSPEHPTGDGDKWLNAVIETMTKRGVTQVSTKELLRWMDEDRKKRVWQKRKEKWLGRLKSLFFWK